jgi:ribonucleoside-triphosphate reductase
LKLLTKEFLSQYPDTPEHMNDMALFTFYRTYSRWVESKGRRETFKEAIARAVDYNVSISLKEFEKNGFPVPYETIKVEAETLFDNIFNLKQGLSGRTHWVGGADTKIAEKSPLANFNCAFTEINDWEDIVEVFYLLLIGTGVGVSSTKEMASNMPPIRRDYTLTHSEYNPVAVEERLEHSKFNVMENGYAKIYVGDSKDGWIEALQMFFQFITNPHFDKIRHIKISYNSVRPRGEKLKTFGGTASGHETLREMFEGINKVFQGTLDRTLDPMERFESVDDDNNAIIRYKVRPIHIMDICNLLGSNVVAGGVRRTALIFLCDENDEESIFAKYGINGIYDWEEHLKIGERLYDFDMCPDWWTDEELVASKQHLTHRHMSNNSISFQTKPKKELLEVIFNLIKDTGEPGFINMEAAQKRRPNAKGVNPCAEILADSKQVCNLTTTNVMAFVNDDGVLDYSGLMEAQALSVRAGIRMTCIDLELPKWDITHKRDRLVGVSLTGWKDAMDKLNYNKEQEEQLLQLLSNTAFTEANKYAYSLRIPAPLLVTTVKPEGTLSQVFNGVSSGLHVSHSPYYIRRVRINSNDPLVEVAKELDWDIEEDANSPNTMVISFPCSTPAKKTREQQTIEEQFETYLMFQRSYADHNSSNTISVKDDEWEKALELVWDNWDDFIGVTFLPYDGGSYTQMPYEEITKEEFEEMSKNIKPFSIDLLTSVENEETEKDMENLQGCEGNVCPVF